MIGPKAHGKSSAVNSIASISTGKRTTVCNAGETSSDNVTTVYRQLEIPGHFQTFRLCDVRGLTKEREASNNLLKDIEYIVQGHVKTGYKMDARGPIKEDDKVYFISNPTYERKVHGVIIVFDITEAYDIHSSHIEDIKVITNRLNELNVPVSVLLTKADLLCQRVRDGIRNIYRSKKVIEAANKVHAKLGIPKKNIYPVANFEDNVKFGWEESVPLLTAIQAFLGTAANHLHSLQEGKTGTINCKIPSESASKEIT
ncbi:uncharacterized protein LOC123546130 isoform X2 [Mercenaria mercenaria]|nr:uncharacterized protein LOC123546130 isoform X2 [Mercenaria mercenaria]